MRSLSQFSCHVHLTEIAPLFRESVAELYCRVNQKGKCFSASSQDRPDVFEFRYAAESLLSKGAARESLFMATKKIFVGNLPFSATHEEVRELFSAHGAVHDVNLINDRETGRPRGFGFVEMDEQGAIAAMRALDGYEFEGRDLRVNEATERRRR